MTDPKPQRRWSSMSTSLKTLVVTVMALALAIPIMFTFLQSNQSTELDATGQPKGVAEHSHYLDYVGEDAPTVVEFLDFECPACGSIYPYVEEIREHYKGEINYVVRYFPLSGHRNAMTAALAVEAAAQQDQFESMYQRVFETQAEWGGSQEDESATFRGYAQSMGLDMAAYDAAVADEANEARIIEDYNAGVALGVTGTPSFYLDGKPLRLTDPNDLPNAIDQVLGK